MGTTVILCIKLNSPIDSEEEGALKGLELAEEAAFRSSRYKEEGFG